MEENINNIKYSVLMSVYKNDNPEWLVISIDSMLNQTIKPNEFVIIEDGPLNKELNDVIEKYQKEYSDIFKIKKLDTNKGLGPALNIGINECSNDLIARIDSDDYSVPDRIQKQLKVLIDNPELGLIGSNIAEFHDDISNIDHYVILPEKHDDIYKFSKKRCPFRHSVILYKKDAVLNAGNYNNCYLHEDYDLYIRMIQNGTKCYNIQEILGYVRINSDFYKRRGGWKYLKNIVNFKTKQLKSGYFSLWDYLVSVVPHIIVCLIPNKLRDYIYRNCLRKKNLN